MRFQVTADKGFYHEHSIGSVGEVTLIDDESVADQSKRVVVLQFLDGHRWVFYLEDLKRVADNKPLTNKRRKATRPFARQRTPPSLAEAVNTFLSSRDLTLLQKTALAEDTIYVVWRIVKWHSRSSRSSRLLTVRHLITLLAKRMPSSQVRKHVSMLRNKGLIAVDPVTKEISPNKDLIAHVRPFCGLKLDEDTIYIAPFFH